MATRSDDGAIAAHTRAAFQDRTDPRLNVGGPHTIASKRGC